MKSAYFQVVNFFQSMPIIWFATIWLLLLAGGLLSIMNFFKAHNGTQKTFEKAGLLVLAILLFAFLIYLTYIRH